MISLFISFAVLLIGYVAYGKTAEKIFAPDDRPTPAVSKSYGVDFVPMKTWKAFLIQLLNIAGTGPIFGALMGAVFGPVVFLWIVLGSILGGAVHDYMCGMISSRHDGASIAELSGTYLGKPAKVIMRVFSVILLILCGTVFVTSPAGLLDKLTPDWMNGTFWAVVILIYYLLATLLPIDKLIGKLYHVFGVLLIVMAGAVIGGILFSGGKYIISEISLTNLHPKGTPIWPYMFVTVACGAVSGFHATQSPMIAKCITSEKEGRRVFIAGVVICPITSGDKAFRSARLILAETLSLDQKKLKNRLLITIPLLIAGGLLTWFAVVNDNGFQVVWRYFSWSNQTLAMIALWVATAYLLKKGKYRFGSLITAIPAAFMTAVSITYILMAKEGLSLNQTVSYITGAAVVLTALCVYLIRLFASGLSITKKRIENAVEIEF